MTKAEIIRKLTKMAGVPDLDAKLFFEEFLRRTVLQLKPGETLKVKGFGYFQLRTGKIKNSTTIDANPLSTGLMVFYPLNSRNEEPGENMIFNLPVKREQEFNPVDSYFSLSFGKPVSPLKNANVSEYYVPQTGLELQRFIENKVDKLISEVELIENYARGNEMLLIDPDAINPNQMELNWEEIKLLEESVSAAEKEQLPWDFGKELEKQIKEESLLDIESEDKLFVNYDDLKEVSWEFGEEENFIIEKEPPKPDNFQRVNSFTREFNIDNKNFGLTKSERDLSWNFQKETSSDDTDLIKSIDEEINEDGFAEVKGKERKFKFETDISAKYDEDIVDTPLEEQEIVKQTDEVPENKIPAEPQEVPGKDVDKPEMFIIQEAEVINEPEEPPQRTDRSIGFSKKRGIGIYVAAALIIFAGLGVYLYLKMADSKFFSGKKVVSVFIPKSSSSSVIIERNFDIPVTYPYLRENKLQLADSVLVKTDSVKNEVPPQTMDKQKVRDLQKVKVAPKTITDNSQFAKLKEFIYKSGDKYMVQISSWPSEQSARKQAAYYEKKGFNTDIIKASLNKGVWYRVRVGYFNSESEAENFSNNNK
jgi:hypothetical protein